MHTKRLPEKVFILAIPTKCAHYVLKVARMSVQHFVDIYSAGNVSLIV